MNSDDVVWSILRYHTCSFKRSSDSKVRFCTSQYNSTGLCNRSSCPLANSRYATVREIEGILYLYLKTPERVCFPNEMWERVRLSKQTNKAVFQIEENMLYWPRKMVIKCKLRFVRLYQMLVRMRKLRLLESGKKLICLPKRIERRICQKEKKALIAAKLDGNIESTLLDRLKKGIYHEVYKFDPSVFEENKNAAKSKEIAKDSDDELDNEYVEDEETSDDEVNSESGQREVVKDDLDESDEEEDIEDMGYAEEPTIKNAKKRNIEIEYEYNDPDDQMETVYF